MLYIIEPSFLFFVRTRTRKEAKTSQLGLFEKLVFAAAPVFWTVE
jgi:hypothetical protein